ncbi:hypothetical protein IV417_18925 [Alphaproteobacteria bacterium KMM 3653]|uniref:Lipoprotein n=1 Tax=Harenicola maris TaxID=2841044 RepID=A0AAP2G5L2_9RHOB|nr:hypothetical protein [Harenicola maris]
MFHKAIITGALVTAALAGCSQKQSVDAALAPTLRVEVTDVVVATKRVQDGHKHDLETDQIESIVSTVAGQRLLAANPTGPRPVTARIEITQIYIANPVLGALLGSSSSNMNAVMVLTDAATGSPVTGPIPLYGTTPPRPTIIGAATIRSPEKEVEIVARNLAENAKIAIFGE